MEDLRKRIEILVSSILISRRFFVGPAARRQLFGLVKKHNFDPVFMKISGVLGRLSWYLKSLEIDLVKVEKGKLDPSVFQDYLTDLLGMKGNDNPLQDIEDFQKSFSRIGGRVKRELNPDFFNHLKGLSSLFLKIKATLNRLKKITKESPPQELQVLFHATTRASQIVAEGFQKKAPKGTGGLLTEKVPGVSFTFSLEIAREISKSQKDLALIFRGAFTGNSLYQYARKKGLIKDIPRIYTEASGWAKGLFTPKKEYTSKDLIEEKDVWTLISIYRIINKYMIGQGKKFDVMINREQLVKSRGYLERVALSDIAVLVCLVDLNSPGVSLRSLEKEYRVPQKAIRKIMKSLPVKPNLNA